MNQLKAWVYAERGRISKLARHLGVGPTYMQFVVNGKKPISINHMTAIEQFTNGEVTRQSMCPDWQRIWPELADTAQPESREVANG